MKVQREGEGEGEEEGERDAKFLDKGKSINEKNETRKRKLVTWEML